MSSSYGPLPELLFELTEVVGLETTLKIASNYGGVRVEIPYKAKKDHWLTDLVGIKRAWRPLVKIQVLQRDLFAKKGNNIMSKQRFFDLRK